MTAVWGCFWVLVYWGSGFWWFLLFCGSCRVFLSAHYINIFFIVIYLGLSGILVLLFGVYSGILGLLFGVVSDILRVAVWGSFWYFGVVSQMR